uniref:Uncharacterized protein n=1 Tax=Mus musculus TaxID=10090 RepID=Q9D4Q9_MOUSE|nr:unnamed protein product [Mus musculus]
MYQPGRHNTLPGNGLEIGQSNRSQETPLHPSFFFPGSTWGSPRGPNRQTGVSPQALGSIFPDQIHPSVPTQPRLLPLRSPSIDISDLQELRESWKLETCAGRWLCACSRWLCACRCRASPLGGSFLIFTQ